MVFHKQTSNWVAPLKAEPSFEYWSINRLYNLSKLLSWLRARTTHNGDTPRNVLQTQTEKYFLLLIIALFIAIVFYFFMVQDKTQNPSQVCFREHCFALEIADTPEKRAQGLMFRQELAQDKAMLFIYPRSGVYKFWMKNTLIPLDIVWLDRNKKVVFIAHNAPPCYIEECPLFGNNESSNYVLEINAGIAEKIGLETGDNARF
jgi:uncharacterized protein